MSKKKQKSLGRQSKEFAVVLAVGGGLAAGWLIWTDRPDTAMYAGAAAGVVLVLAFVLQPVWLAFFKLWMRFAEGMGWVMTRVILSVFYLLVMTPFGVVMRLAGKRPLDMRWKDGKSSYWIDKTPSEPTVERYSRLY